MPVAIFKAVREVSSEDTAYPAENLLKQRPGKKWKTKTSGDKSAYVILELEQDYQITGIDIGNEHSAFVEVLVGKQGCAREDFTEILITSSFMTPNESRNSTNPNRVRCFNEETLVSTAASDKWKLVKILCTQPFNKHVPYGLSFIKLHVAETAPKLSHPITQKCSVKENSTANSSVGLRKFALREDSPDVEQESSTLFSRWKSSRNSLSLDHAPTAAAAIRKASSSVAHLSDISHKVKTPIGPSTVNAGLKADAEEREIKVLDSNRDYLLFGESDEDCNETKKQDLANATSVPVKHDRVKNEKTREQQKTPSSNGSSIRKAAPNTPNLNKGGVEIPKQGIKRRSSPPISSGMVKRTAKPTQYRPFNQLLRGVVLVISGIQNPDRADLRNKALAMGAKYKTDWEPGCTHLICAFRNTPKYNQVKGKGKIVTRSWIEKGFTLKKYLPWRRYALQNSEFDQPESDEEIFDESLQPTSTVLSDCEIQEPKLPVESRDHIDISVTENPTTVSDSDTDDELQRVISDKKRARGTAKAGDTQNISKDCDVYSMATDEEDFLKDKEKENKNLLIFYKLKFVMCSDVSATDKQRSEKLIRKHGGCLIQNLAEANLAVSNKELDLKHSAIFRGDRVQPSWIYECDSRGELLPYNSPVVKTCWPILETLNSTTAAPNI